MKDGALVVMQLTRDQTKAMEMLDDGIIDFQQYHAHPDRLALTGGLGITTEPTIQTFSDMTIPGDFMVLTTDGIHYAIKPDVMADMIILSQQCDSAAETLCTAAKSEKYVDNGSAIIIWRTMPAQKQPSRQE